MSLPDGKPLPTSDRESIEAMLAHPNFMSAVLMSARGTIEVHGRGSQMSWLLGDRARALFGHRLLVLDVSRNPADPRSGILPTRVQADCVELGLCSAGRAMAMLALMRAGGYLAFGTATEDKRVRRLIATPRLWELQRDRVRRQFEAIAKVSDTSRRALAHMGNPDFEAPLLNATGEAFGAGYRVMDFAPRLRLFSERSAGIVVLYELLLASAEAGAFPLTAPIAVSIAAIARRFGVSRTHILRLFRDAEAEGLLRREGERIVPAPEIGQELLRMFAAMFNFIDRGAALALAAVEKEQGPGSVPGPLERSQ